MRILYIITKADIGGAQTHVQALCTYMKSQGHVVGVLSSGSGWLKDEILGLGCEYFESNSLSNTLNPVTLYASLREAQNVVGSFKPDLVHCHSSIAGLVGRLAIKNTIRTLYTAHGWGFSDGASWIQKKLSLAAERYVSKYCEKIICVSKHIKDVGAAHAIGDDSKFRVIYNGVASQPIKKNQGESIKKIVSVGRLAEPKLPELLVGSIATLKDSLSNISCEIIGDGPKRGIVERKIHEYGLEKNIQLSGNLQHSVVLDRISSADALMLLTRSEAFGLAAAEAMARGIIVIASNVGGLTELIQNEENGLLVENTVSSVASALTKILSDSNLVSKIQKNAPITMQQFSVEKMCRKTEELYLQNYV